VDVDGPQSARGDKPYDYRAAPCAGVSPSYLSATANVMQCRCRRLVPLASPETLRPPPSRCLTVMYADARGAEELDGSNDTPHAQAMRLMEEVGGSSDELVSLA